jgi:hypothetical protein
VETEIARLQKELGQVAKASHPLPDVTATQGVLFTPSAKGGDVTIAFDVPTAIRFAANDNIDTWVHVYLTLGPRPKPELSYGLRLQQRWWYGPLEVPLDRLMRCVGPEPGMEYRVSYASWEQRIRALAASFTDLQAIPPLIVAYRYSEDSFSIRDGNHRYEAIRRKGWTTCWVVIWYTSQADYEHDVQQWQSAKPA